MCMASLSSCTQRLAGRCGVSPLEEVRKDYRLSAGGDFPLPHNKTNYYHRIVRYISMNENSETTSAIVKTSQAVETSASAENSKRAENVETSASVKASQAGEMSASAENSKRAENVKNSASVKASQAVDTSALAETTASVEYTADTARTEYLFTCQLFFDALFLGCFVAYVFWKEIFKR